MSALRRNADELPLGEVLVGDVRDRLDELPNAAVDCVISSPPYWAQRDYSHSGQIGAEATADAWATQIAEICTKLARVLTPTGSLWLNLGDSYSRHPREGTNKKSLLLGPQRLALRMARSGWLLRNQIVWAKTNPMPSSVTDRLTTTHEFLYLFTKEPEYFFDLDAIREPASTRIRSGRASRGSYPPRKAVPSLGVGTSPRINLNLGLVALQAAGRGSHPLGKNPGDVWRFATARYRGAHFATFPIELVRRPLLSTCPERVCCECGMAWRRATQVVDGRRLAIGSLRAACKHRRWRPGRVLDPFIGSGTVAIAAEAYGRDWLGIELNPEYAELAQQRIAGWRMKNKKPQP
ncbi:DNA modification methylase [Kibdelosporangium banguiense]|uniref:Methyltransferase n=1 Tax=Kibdelosporangium banguiense TaxID=1365924 RepID=A0ABS4TE38_9PSEU|nr:site-specific DNA-methyltransferase [Kibdelosporangium banguiense]MBP2322678.1 DNA modification methylase [Kibdelosporangium banguiense]